MIFCDDDVDVDDDDVIVAVDKDDDDDDDDDDDIYVIFYQYVGRITRMDKMFTRIIRRVMANASNTSTYGNMICKHQLSARYIKIIEYYKAVPVLDRTKLKVRFRVSRAQEITEVYQTV